MTKAIIRYAVEADCPAMLELIRELAILEKASDAVTVSMQEFIDAGFGENPIWGAFVAELDGKIVGISLYYIRYSTWKGRRLYLEDLIVTESMRGYGIGKQLFEETLNFGKSKGYQGMVWQVLDWNEPAIQFYKKYKADFDAEWINVSITY
ncbi:GNAT family acetyltransferase [Sphingobacterium sp. ML3W]|uniref:GNAT family N-acetyltransferase n=1 Tax=Sphingobacterium sp. ML3W TaxID=1538644 RepID=UPI0004F910D9|nr:GNAT family N-acetyltransferase [Sphingobacterium sp. ML3W]AIM37486.1 GNAT family acetyltransferase [Sphingobacterium sp. ML3W]